jgi:hypothetical protein
MVFQAAALPSQSRDARKSEPGRHYRGGTLELRWHARAPEAYAGFGSDWGIIRAAEALGDEESKGARLSQRPCDCLALIPYDVQP